MKALLETRFWQKSMRKKDKKEKAVKTEGEGALPLLLDGSSVVVEPMTGVNEGLLIAHLLFLVSFCLFVFFL